METHAVLAAAVVLVACARARISLCMCVCLVCVLNADVRRVHEFARTVQQKAKSHSRRKSLGAFAANELRGEADRRHRMVWGGYN